MMPRDIIMSTIAVVGLSIGCLSWWRFEAQRKRIDLQATADRQAAAQSYAKVVSGDNNQRADLARRLHEEVAQSIVGARMYLSALEAGADAQQAEVLHAVGRSLERSTQDLRDIAMELSPFGIEQYGLGVALEGIATRVKVQAGVDCVVKLGDLDAVEQDVARACYRAAAVVIGAAALNGKARVIKASAEVKESTLQLAVSWDADGGEDLREADEQVRLVGGRLMRVYGKSDTCVLLEAPIRAA